MLDDGITGGDNVVVSDQLNNIGIIIIIIIQSEKNIKLLILIVDLLLQE